MENDDVIEKLVKQSAKDAFNLLACKGCDKCLIYPYSNKKEGIRCSEQELKQLFIENLCRNNNDSDSNKFFYSVETPTVYEYSFTKGNENKPKIKKRGEKSDGQNYISARIDLSLYQNNDVNNSKYHIEFKNDQPDKFDISKDILKLIAEGNNSKNYFIHIICRNGDKIRNDTKESLKEKFINAYINAKHETNSNYKQHKVTVYVIYICNYICKDKAKLFIEKKVFNPNNIYEPEKDKMEDWEEIKFD